MPLIEKKAAPARTIAARTRHVDIGFRRAVRYRDDIAAAGDEASLLPGFQAPAGALSVAAVPSGGRARPSVGWCACLADAQHSSAAASSSGRMGVISNIAHSQRSDHLIV
jgi:hypothetical protein